jgi:hypothetical protein
MLRPVPLGSTILGLTCDFPAQRSGLHRIWRDVSGPAEPSYLATSLNNHAALLAEAGRRAEAVPISEQAVTLRQELAELNRDAYLPDYTNSVTVLGYVLVEGAQFREATAPLVHAFMLAQEPPDYAQAILATIVGLLRRAYAAPVILPTDTAAPYTAG